MNDVNGIFRLTTSPPCQHRTHNNPKRTRKQRQEIAARQKDNTTDRPAWREAKALKGARIARSAVAAKPRAHV